MLVISCGAPANLAQLTCSIYIFGNSHLYEWHCAASSPSTLRRRTRGRCRCRARRPPRRCLQSEVLSYLTRARAPAGGRMMRSPLVDALPPCATAASSVTLTPMSTVGAAASVQVSSCVHDPAHAHTYHDQQRWASAAATATSGRVTRAVGLQALP